MPTENISLSPKARFCANTAAASAHSDLMATPAFQSACATALLEYQLRIAITAERAAPILRLAPSEMDKWSTAKLRGAQEFLSVLMNLGIPAQPRGSEPDASLVPPETTLDRPYVPPTKKE